MTTTAQRGIAQLAGALRLMEAFRLAIDPHVWSYLPNLTQAWLDIVTDYGLPPWNGLAPDYRTDLAAAVDHWVSALPAHRSDREVFAETNGLGDLASRLTLEPDATTIDRFTRSAFGYFGMQYGSWQDFPAALDAYQAIPPGVLHPFDDGGWCVRQCWCALGAFVLAAHDLFQSAPAPARLTSSAGPSALATKQTASQLSPDSAAPKSKAPQLAVVVGGTGLALVLVWILLA